MTNIQSLITRFQTDLDHESRLVNCDAKICMSLHDTICALRKLDFAYALRESKDNI